MAVNTVTEWRKFSQHMEEYIRERTGGKYGIENPEGFDLISIIRCPVEGSRFDSYSALILIFQHTSSRKEKGDLEKNLQPPSVFLKLWT